ncbi:MAG: inner membrane CreD family protein [Myxococcales bacterium]|nr:inner membrane CreD family protein [Myxococcales bacterium]
MHPIARAAALAVILAASTMAWWILAGTMQYRTDQQEQQLAMAVAELWGQPMTQTAPTLALARKAWVNQAETLYGADGMPLRDEQGVIRTRTKRVEVSSNVPVPPSSSDLDVDLALDQRRKGLLWFSLYDVDFSGEWSWSNPADEAETLLVTFTFPIADAIYDDVAFTVDGVERMDATPQNGQVSLALPVEPHGTVRFGAAYRSRGRDSFVYRPLPDWQVGEVRDLRLAMTTDFDTIDFPPQTLSPGSRQARDDGHGQALVWDFRRVVTGHGMGMTMPTRIQAGPLGAAMAASAPISLGLYMAWIFVLGMLKKVEVHPINHLFLAAAFFAFHLLFAYSADRLPVEAAFALSAGTSLFLTTSYLRLVVGPRFALVEAGVAQLLYQVGFSLAHFVDGATGLTITVLGIGTLFALMQLTGRIRWSEVMSLPTSGASGAPRSWS